MSPYNSVSIGIVLSNKILLRGVLHTLPASLNHKYIFWSPIYVYNIEISKVFLTF